jgi:phage tail sheath protein FI
LAALSALDFIGEAVSAAAGDVAQAAARRGLAALDAVDEVALLAVPDIHVQPRPAVRQAPPPACVIDDCLPVPALPPSPLPRAVGDEPPRFGADEIARVQEAMVLQCERRRDRVALLDAPFDACTRLTFAASELRAWRRRFDSPFAALYAPWLEVVDPARAVAGGRPGPLTRKVPPCGHVAGMIAANDLRRGVHIAPANVALRWCQRPTLDLEGERHGLLNSLGVNVLRAEAGRGTRVLGARTVSSDTDWRFLNVRRLVCMVARAIDVSIQWAVFEPNDWRTRAKLTLVIGSFLRELWARGALVGSTAEEAFFVRCDETNNPPDGRSRGELVAMVGIAPSVPFEFIVLRIGREADGLEVAEAGTVGGER